MPSSRGAEAWGGCAGRTGTPPGSCTGPGADWIRFGIQYIHVNFRNFFNDVPLEAFRFLSDVKSCIAAVSCSAHNLRTWHKT